MEALLPHPITDAGRLCPSDGRDKGKGTKWGECCRWREPHMVPWAAVRRGNRCERRRQADGAPGWGRHGDPGKELGVVLLAREATGGFYVEKRSPD